MTTPVASAPALAWPPAVWPPAGAPADPRPGEEVAVREAFGKALIELADADPRLFVLDGDLANSTRADIFAEARPTRFLEMGIAEQNMMGVAAGMATLGLVPWLSSFACFLAKRALDQLRVVVAQPQLPVKLAAAYGGMMIGPVGKTHQAVEDMAVMRAMPHMTLIAPADAVECRQAMWAAHLLPGPVYVRLTRDPLPVIFGGDYRFALGRAVSMREGGELGIVSTGSETQQALKAAELLAAGGIEASVLHVPTIKPLDTQAVVALAERCGRILSVEDHSIIGGLGGALAETLAEQRPTPMRRVGVQDRFGTSASSGDLLRYFGLDAESIAAAARAWVRG
jgi:transketolase